VPHDGPREPKLGSEGRLIVGNEIVGNDKRHAGAPHEGALHEFVAQLAVLHDVPHKRAFNRSKQPVEPKLEQLPQPPTGDPQSPTHALPVATTAGAGVVTTAGCAGLTGTGSAPAKHAENNNTAVFTRNPPFERRRLIIV
jgi:hypothetical protein